MWGRRVDGLTLTFHLAGINNQNFLMRDEETGSYWQQISGRAISGPLSGEALELIPSDELSLSLWKTEQPRGTVLRDVAAYAPEYAKPDWDVKMKKAPTVLNYSQRGLAPRDLMLGIDAFGASRAFPYEDVVKQKLVRDHVGSEPVVLVLGPDNQSVRAFHARLAGTAIPPEFYRTEEGMMDDATGSRWNFQGCAIDGKAKGTCLESIYLIKDYWFDWRHYHPNTTVYGR